MKKVLIVEDDLMIADILEYVLLRQGFDICGIARSPQDAILLANQNPPELYQSALMPTLGGIPLVANFGFDSPIAAIRTMEVWNGHAADDHPN